MKLHLPENDDLKEIVFENRNKAYGAYQLRSNYHRTLNQALMISLVSVGLFAGMIILIHKLTGHAVLPDVRKTEPYTITTVALEQPMIKPETKKEFQPMAKTEVKPLLPKPLEQNFNVVNEKPADPALAEPTTTIPPNEGIETGALASGTTGNLSAMNGNTSTLIPSAPIEMASVDIAPEFPGGIDKFYRYLRGKLSFTSAAVEARLSERMYVNFVVDKDGKITLVKILKGVGYGMDEQVIHILTKSPDWKPGIFHGQPVSTIVRLPISFQMLQ